MLDSMLEILYFVLVCVSVVVMAAPLAFAITAWEEASSFIDELRDMDLDIESSIC